MIIFVNDIPGIKETNTRVGQDPLFDRRHSYYDNFVYIYCLFTDSDLLEARRTLSAVRHCVWRYNFELHNQFLYES
jgi:hypothetical protein